MGNKGNYKELISGVRNILFSEWDPVGVNDNPNLQDEYDRYIGRIIQMLSEDSSIHDLVKLLKDIEVNEIGCSTSDAIVFNTAKKLLKLKNIYTP